MVSHDSHPRERGQVLVIVAVGMVALIAMVGLVLDGGASFGQRRSQQRGADLAALAGANDLLLHGDVNTARSVAESLATKNGYDPAVVTVDVTVTPFASGRAGGKVRVGIKARHQNSFSTIVGLNAWDISVSATAIAGSVTGGSGVGPIIFSANDFQANGQPLPGYTESGCPPAPVTPAENGCPFGTVNGDAPAPGGNDLAWSNYGTGNVDTPQVRNIISGQLVIDRTLALNDYIGQHNNGFHNDLFQAVQQYYAGKDILVPVTTEQVPGIPDGPGSCGGGTPAGGGCFQGWAIFHVVAAIGASDKHIYGYFVSSKFAPGATVEDCTANCPRSFGNNYGLYLIE
jgi:Flp pilus assembly protein TadG